MVHNCLDYTLMDYSLLDNRRLDYTQLDYRRLDYKDVRTNLIGLLVWLDYQNLDYTSKRLHCHLDYIRSHYFGLCNVFSYKEA